MTRILCWLVLLLSCESLCAQQYKVLHSFAGAPNDASYVTGGLALDANGNLYGASANGGSNIDFYGDGGGTAFELSPNGDGTWVESIIYNFCSDLKGMLCLDGETLLAGMTVDSSGNLYGTGAAGGSGNHCPYVGNNGCGVVFKLSPPQQQGGSWTETVLYNFCSVVKNGVCLDGDFPEAPLVFGSDGSMYSTTAQGGTGRVPGVGGGIAFKLTPGSGRWTQSVLYNFCSVGTGQTCLDGSGPLTDGVTFGASGQLYGATMDGGSSKNIGNGVVYQLVPSSGGWKQTVLAAFPSSNQDQGQPSGGVAVDPAGNIYGTYEFPKGGVFRLNPVTKKSAVFQFNGADGEQPIGGVTLDLKHNVLYGTTSGVSGGTQNIYKIDLTTFKETVLYTFCSQPNCTDGSLPWATMIMDAQGNLYGTTEFGGEYNNGVVFEFTP